MSKGLYGSKHALIKGIASVFLSAVLAVAGVGLLPQLAIPVQAVDTITTYTINDASVSQSFSENSTIQINGNGSTTTNTISIDVASGKTVTVRLNNVNVDVLNHNTSAFRITGAGNVIIELIGSNTLKSGNCCAGLQKDSTGTLTISGSGSLTATGGNSGEGSGAGIGGGKNGNGSNIVISGGIVTATGGESGTISGAGIGGGSNGSGTNIVISGGTVTATGGRSRTSISGAGIGGGSSGNGSNIVISGGTVTATGGRGDFSGAGIGGGGNGSGTNIEISGGTVTATGGTSLNGSGAGIGGGAGGNGENISISGGTVYSFGKYAGAGIGGGSTASEITICGSANIFVAGGSSGVAIGSGGFSGNDYSPITTGLYSTGIIRCYPAGTTLSDITGGTAQPASTITGSIPAPTVVYESEPEPPVNDMQEVEDKISEAIALGGTRVVRIEGYPALSYHVLEMLWENPDVTLVSEFSYDGLEYRITIPGSKVKLDPSIKWYGPKYLFPMFFMYGTDTHPAVQAYLDKYEKPAS